MMNEYEKKIILELISMYGDTYTLHEAIENKMHPDPAGAMFLINILDVHDDIFATQNISNNSPLHVALYAIKYDEQFEHFKDVIRLLIIKSPQYVFKLYNDDDFTPFHCAIMLFLNNFETPYFRDFAINVMFLLSQKMLNVTFFVKKHGICLYKMIEKINTKQKYCKYVSKIFDIVENKRLTLHA